MKFPLLLFLFAVAGCCNCPPALEFEKLPKTGNVKHNVMVSIDSAQQVTINNQRVDSAKVDSVLTDAIRKARVVKFSDTPTVVISAHPHAYYGSVFQIMRMAKKDTAKVVANVQ